MPAGCRPTAARPEPAPHEVEEVKVSVVTGAQRLPAEVPTRSGERQAGQSQARAQDDDEDGGHGGGARARPGLGLGVGMGMTPS